MLLGFTVEHTNGDLRASLLACKVNGVAADFIEDGEMSWPNKWPLVHSLESKDTLF